MLTKFKLDLKKTYLNSVHIVDAKKLKKPIIHYISLSFVNVQNVDMHLRRR